MARGEMPQHAGLRQKTRPRWNGRGWDDYGDAGAVAAGYGRRSPWRRPHSPVASAVTLTTAHDGRIGENP